VLNAGASRTAALAGFPDSGVDCALALSPMLTENFRLERIRSPRMKGYEGDSCAECGNLTLIRNGTCLKCDTCGATSGCS
jgi:ribonucleoside-diphosphate reductase alpha chain